MTESKTSQRYGESKRSSPLQWSFGNGHTISSSSVRDSPLSMLSLNISRGMRGKMPYILQWMDDYDIDIGLLQEVGNSKVDYPLLYNHSKVVYMNAHQHTGVAIILSKTYDTYVTTSWHSNCGRAVALLLTLPNKSSIFISSVYLPTALDQSHVTSASAIEATALYNTILGWTQQCPTSTSDFIIGGDLNETFTSIDRDSRTRVNTSRYASALTAAGYADVFRSLHPSQPGFTCATPTSNGVSSARLDYFFYRNSDHPLLSFNSIRICDPIDKVITNHRPLCAIATWDVVHDAKVEETFRPRLPNLSKATEDQKKHVVLHVEQWCIQQCDTFNRLCEGDVNDVEQAGIMLCDEVHRAVSFLPHTGGAKFQSRRRCETDKKRSDACRARALIRLHCSANSYSQRNICLIDRIFSLIHESQPHLSNNWRDEPQRAISVLSHYINSLRRIVRGEVASMKSMTNDEFAHNPTSFIHRMLHGKKAGPIRSIIDPATGTTATTSADIKRVLFDHYSNIFKPSHRPCAPPSWVKDVYKPMESIDPRWYDGLMDEVSTEEVENALKDIPIHNAPGEDGISSSLWKLLARSSITCSVIAQWTSARFRLRFLPSFAKRSIINPILKKANGARELSNIRPITLQCCLIKIGQRILAARLGRTLSLHSILHSAQEAFLPGGDSKRCVDVVLDCAEDAKDHKKCIYCISYDVKAAYDSVRHDDIIASLHRLRLPIEFIELVKDSLTGLLASVRTAFGNTSWFSICRGIPQGDPLAPILFVIYLDSWHCGLHKNPIEVDHPNDGYQIADIKIASKGFADDCLVLSSTIPGLARQHRWSSQWTLWHCIWFNIKKTILTGCDSTRTLMTNDNIMIDVDTNMRQLIPVSTLDSGIPYLGAIVSFDLDYSHAVSKVNSRIGWYINCIERERLPVHRAIYVINNFLIPSLSYILSFVFPTTTESSAWDKQIARCLSNLMGEKGARRVNPSAIACITGVILPSYQHMLIQISETFIRLNTSVKYSITSRARWSARSNSRISRVIKLASTIGMTLQRVDYSSRAWSSYDYVPPASSSRVASRAVATIGGNDHIILNGFYGTWGTNLPRFPTMIMCTDGSATGHHEAVASSSWAVCVVNDWLYNNSSIVPKEGKITMSTMRNICNISGHIPLASGSGVFDAELQAICRALLSVPPSCPLEIYSDSKSSLQSIRSYMSGSERADLRRNGRPWLSLITKMILIRDSHNTFTRLHWINAHSNTLSIPHVGNRCADYAAKHALRNPSMASTTPIPLHLEEKFVCLRLPGDQLVTSDPRQAVRRQLNQHIASLWTKSNTQSSFSSVSLSSRALYDIACKERPHLTGFACRVLTNILQWHRDPQDRKLVSERHCKHHPESILNVSHLISCEHLETHHIECVSTILSTLCREEYQNSTRDLFTHCRHWFENGNRDDIRSLLNHIGFIHSISPDHNPSITGHIMTGSTVGAFHQETALNSLRLRGVPGGLRSDLISSVRLTLLDNLNACFNTAIA